MRPRARTRRSPTSQLRRAPAPAPPGTWRRRTTPVREAEEEAGRIFRMDLVLQRLISRAPGPQPAA
eukprot:14006333-Alexandrium_andersonii.AAC.1